MSYGTGKSGVVVIEQNGPFPPTAEELEAAERVLAGTEPGWPRPCMDCGANLVLVDYRCGDHWHWGYVAAHDDTCPALRVALEGGHEV